MDDFENTLNRIKKYFDDLEECRDLDLRDKRNFYANSMIVFSIINESIILGELFMSKNAMAAPLTYKEMMDILAERKAIDGKLAMKMKLLVQKRNIIAHEYGNITQEDIAELVKKVGIARNFAAALAEKYKK